MSPYAKLYRELNRNTRTKVNNRTVIQIVRKIFFSTPFSVIASHSEGHTMTLRNDLLARAFRKEE